MEVLNLPTIVGTIAMILMVGVLSFFGSRIIEAFLSYWSIFLYLVFIILVIWINSIYGNQISNNFSLTEESASWLKNGIMYAAYNVGPVAAILFCFISIKTRKEALISGGLAGIIAIIVILVSAKFIKAGFDARGEVKEEQRKEKLKQEDEDILDELKRKDLSEEDLKDLYDKIQNKKKDDNE